MKKTSYSRLKERLGWDAGKVKDELLASFTHYLHSQNNGVAHYFEEDASEYVKRTGEQDWPLQFTLSFDEDIPFPPPKKPDFTFIDLFAGIGGFRIAFQEKNGKCVFSSEWDKFAKKTYEANFGEVPFGDITRINADKVPEHDVLVAGFPCQPFSIAGVSKKKSLGYQHGFLDETQGTLFYDIVRVLKEKRPKAFLLENVKNLRSHDQGRTYHVVKEALKELGYTTFDRILDASEYVPQHRERIFIVGFDQERYGEEIDFSFPEATQKQPKLKEILNEKEDPRYTLTDKLWDYLQGYAIKHKEKGNGFGFGLIDPEGIARTLSARYFKDGSEILVPQGKGKNPRRLSPEECKRLMGYPEAFRIKDIGVSDTQLYKQFGNSVVVPVAKAVASKMMAKLQEKEEGMKKGAGEEVEA